MLAKRQPYIAHTMVFAVTAVLLFTALLRLQNLVSFAEWPDEVRSVWRVQFDLTNTLTRNPPDWPPTYEVILWVWARIGGSALEVSRFLSVLFSLLGAAFSYRAALRLTRSITAALLSMLVYATLGYLIFAGVDVRAYGLMLALGALAFWLTLRWLDNPSAINAVSVAITLAVMFHTSFTSAPYIAFLTVFALVMKPRRFLSWIAIGFGVLALCLPILPQFFKNGLSRVGDRMAQALPAFGTAMIKVYHDFGGSDVFVILLAVAVALLVWLAIRAPARRRGIALLAVWLFFPVAVYAITNNQEFMKPRYMWWVALGLMLVIGYAALQLPRRLRLAALAVFLVLPFVPVDYNLYRLAITTAPPFRETFAWFAKQIRPGDVLVIDPKCACGDQFAWDYFVPQYFPTGYLPIVAHPGTASRVWYLSTTGWPRDDSLVAEVEHGRKASIFYGPWFFLLRLYEGPPSWIGLSFGGKIRFHGAEISQNDTIMAKDEAFQVKLWWSAQQPLDRNYSISVALLNGAGKIVVQADGPANAPDTPKDTSAWKPDTYYEDYRDFRLPSDLEDGTYLLVVTVYQWWDNTRLTPEDNALWPRVDTGSNSGYVIIQRISVVS